ncbi:MAG TPA: hypothetical protein VM513_30785 [Kofleriaceae bacterium]|nr:hypothetical protein [Kofleriaceae bacterium]
MVRIALVLLALIAACKGKAAKQAGAGSAGSAAAKAAELPAPQPPPTGSAPKIVWTDTDGEVLVATDGEVLTAACGLTGKVTPTEVTLAGDTQPWNNLLRDGRTYSLPRLDWKIVVSDKGMVNHKVGGTETLLGTVTGLTGDAELQWFGALVVAAPMVKHELALTSWDGAYKLSLGGAADLRAWEVKQGTTPIAVRRRGDLRPVFTDEPAFATDKVTVSMESPGNYLIQIVRDDGALKAAFTSDTYRVHEHDNGELSIDATPQGAKPLKPKPFAKLVGRQKCRAHDQAIIALLWSFVASKSGHDVAF